MKALKSQDGDLDVVAAGRFSLEGKEYHLVFELEKVFLNTEEGYTEITIS